MLTDWLLQVVVKNKGLWILQVSRQLVDVISCQTVSTGNCATEGLCPKNFLLF